MVASNAAENYSSTNMYPSRDSIDSISKSSSGRSTDISPKKPGGSCAELIPFMSLSTAFTGHLHCENFQSSEPIPLRNRLVFN